MPYRRRDSRRALAHEAPGSVDYPFDRDERSAGAVGLASDAACTVPWRADGFEAIQVFVDPALLDRAAVLCSTIEVLAETHRTIDRLGDAVIDYADREDLSASVFEEPPDDLSTGTVAIAFTVG
jgi:hypothetical protein